METKANIIRRYADAAPESKVDIICRHYPQIDGIINARIAGMKYINWEEKEKNRQADLGELGIRIQSGNGYSDPTSNDGHFRADLESAIRSCGIEYHSAVKKISKIRKYVNREVGEILNATSCQRGTKSSWYQMTEGRRA